MAKISSEKVERLTNNNTFAGIIAALTTFALGIVGTLFFDRTVIYKEYIPIDNITSLYKEYLVSPGLVDEGILAENLNSAQQVEYIRDEILEIQTDIDGIKKNEDSQQQEYEALQNDYQRTLDEKKRLEEYIKTLPIAELSEANIVVSGENLDTTVQDFIAIVNGHTYYLEDFLNQILPERISYQSGTVKYGITSPEKVNVVKEDRMLSDNNGFLVYNQNDSFYMGGVEFNSGLVLAETWQDCVIYINANKKYSKLVFTLGHVDDSRTTHRPLKISYLNADGEYVPVEFDCYGGMPTQERSVDIYNTEKIKIEVPKGNYEQFGLADMYLVK